MAMETGEHLLNAEGRAPQIGSLFPNHALHNLGLHVVEVLEVELLHQSGSAPVPFNRPS